MASLQELERALINADKAGDVEAAKALAVAIKQARAQAPEATPTEDPGFGQAALIGAGRTLDRLYEGIKQSGLNIGAALGSKDAQAALEAQKAREDENTRLYGNLQKIRPGATMLGEAAPLVLAPMLGASVPAIAASAALPGLIEYGTTGERLGRGAMGAAGGAVGAGAGKLIGGILKPTALTQAQQKALEAAKRLDVKLTSGEASGNRALRWAESASADIPFAAGIASRRTAANEKSLAAAAARSIGQNAPELTDDVLAAAHQQISGEFGRILGGVQVKLDKAFENELNAVTGSKVLKSLRDESVRGVIDEIKAIAKTGAADGEWFQQNKSALDALIRAAYNTPGQAPKAKALEGVEKALSRAAMRSLPQADASAYKAAERQWANLRLLETGKVREGGRVLPGRLDQALASRYKGAYKEGKIKGELADIASLAGTLRPPPQSGTVPRAFYTGAGMAGALMEPTTTAAAIGAPTLLQGITASPAMRKYMTEGLLQLSPEELLLLTRSGGGLLGSYGASQ